MEAMAGRMGSRGALFGWGLGFLLIFVGTIVAIILTNPAVCYTNTPVGCTASNYEAYFNGIFIGKLLWAIGLLFIAGASGVRLHGTGRPASGAPEEVRWALAERWANLIVIVVSVILLLVLLYPPVLTVVTG